MRRAWGSWWGGDSKDPSRCLGLVKYNLVRRVLIRMGLPAEVLEIQSKGWAGSPSPIQTQAPGHFLGATAFRLLRVLLVSALSVGTLVPPTGPGRGQTPRTASLSGQDPGAASLQVSVSSSVEWSSRGWSEAPCRAVGPKSAGRIGSYGPAPSKLVPIAEFLGENVKNNNNYIIIMALFGVSIFQELF